MKNLSILKFKARDYSSMHESVMNWMYRFFMGHEESSQFPAPITEYIKGGTSVEWKMMGAGQFSSIKNPGTGNYLLRTFNRWMKKWMVALELEGLLLEPDSEILYSETDLPLKVRLHRQDMGYPAKIFEDFIIFLEKLSFENLPGITNIIRKCLVVNYLIKEIPSYFTPGLRTTRIRGPSRYH